MEREVDREPDHRSLVALPGVDVVALTGFGGERGDPVAAAVRVDGWTRLQVVAPPDRATWDRRTEEGFRTAVRRLAATHDLLGLNGAVRVLFDPPESPGAATRDVGTGEPVERV